MVKRIPLKQFLFGLGNFGYYLAMNLHDKEHDVLVIDKDTNRIQEIKDKVTRAVVADATDIKTLETLAIKEMVPDQLNMIPTGQYFLKDGDILILLGPNDKLNLLREKEQ